MQQTVTEYLERARECAAQAEALEGDEKIKMLAVAEAWLKVADEVAKQSTASCWHVRFSLIATKQRTSREVAFVPRTAVSRCSKFWLSIRLPHRRGRAAAAGR